MELNDDIYAKMIAINWFRLCGSELPSDMPFPVQRIPTATDAVTSTLGPIWQDARTEAQGDLTGHLAKHHADAYGFWNSLAKASRQRIQKEVMPIVNEGLGRISAIELSNTVLLDLNRIALQSAYAKRFRRIPDFFLKLYAIYERGHLPCGWNGSLTLWPEGQWIVY